MSDALRVLPASSCIGGRPATGRWLGLDALRGLSIAAMILVNNPGRWSRDYQYGPLRHADWHGCTFTDLVFPTFLFCAGVAIVPALSKKLASGAARGPILAGLGRRVVALVLLGLFLSAFSVIASAADGDVWGRLSRLRFPGVLQRIGVCYGAAAVLFLCTSVRVQRMVLFACLLAYWPLLTVVSVPGFGAPDLSTAMGTLPGYLDRLVFGSHIYVLGQYDPEGLLSTMPALATCLFGVEAGRIMKREQAVGSKVRQLLGMAAMLLVLGGAWSVWLPFNKYLWTSSYAVWTAGIATLGLALCVWAFEQRRWLRLAYPLRVYGTNALLVFVGSGVLARVIASLIRFDVDGKRMSLKSWFFDSVLLPMADPKLASLSFALLWILGWFCVLRVLYQKKLIWKV